MSNEEPKWDELKIDTGDAIGLGKQNQMTTKAVNEILDFLAQRQVTPDVQYTEATSTVETDGVHRAEPNPKKRRRKE